MAGFGSADDLDALVEEVDMPPRKRIQRCLQTKSTEDQRCLQRTMAEALEPWKKIVTSQDEIVTSQKKLVRLLEYDNTRLLLELARHTGVYATRPLIEYGLNEYAVKNDVKEWTTTLLSKTFIQHCLFKPAPDDTELQDWVRKKVNRLNKVFRWTLSSDHFFATALWDMYSDLSKRHHGLTGTEEGHGFMITAASPLEVAVAVVVVCALQGQGCLEGFRISGISPDKSRRVWVSERKVHTSKKFPS